MKFSIVAIVICLASSPLFAGKLAGKNKITKANREVAALVEQAQTDCGTKLEVKFEGEFAGWNETISLGGSCGNAAQGLGYMCLKGADNKTEGAKIKKIVCTSGKEAKVTVNGSTINYVMDVESGGMTSEQIAVKLEEIL
jgi:hypothetical protein